MDNVTHSLLGIAVGQWADRRAQDSQPEVQPKKARARRRLWIWTSIIGNNFPDLDVLYTWITPPPLGNLLHHRGHTHTLVGLVPQWFLILFALWIFRKRFGFSELSRQEWKAGAFLGFLGLCLHIVADSFNSYGIHPFFPFWNGWIFGDAIFIVEPIIWAILSAAIFQSGRNILRFLPPLLLVVLLIFGVQKEYLSLINGSAILVLFLTLLWAFKMTKSQTSKIALLLTGVYSMLSFSLSQRIRSDFIGAAMDRPQIRTLDVVLSPVPANPFCWFTIKISTNEKTYEVKRGLASVLPRWVSAKECQSLGRIQNSEEAELETLHQTQVIWYERYQTPIADFQRIEQDCHLRAWMRFARVPFVQEGRFSDLRFSRNASLRNFSDLDRSADEKCPPHIPKWIPPRWDIIELVGGTSWFN